jgi:chromosome segregation ATPase
MKNHTTSKLAVAVTTLLLTSCCATHQELPLAGQSRRDTLYLNALRYDSIYIDRRSTEERRADTVFKETRCQEYHYKLLHDTLRLHHTDTLTILKEPSLNKELKSSQRELKSAEKKLKAVQKELSATRKELATVQKEFNAEKEELARSKKELATAKRELKAAETKQGLSRSKRHIKPLLYLSLIVILILLLRALKRKLI